LEAEKNPIVPKPGTLEFEQLLTEVAGAEAPLSPDSMKQFPPLTKVSTKSARRSCADKPVGSQSEKELARAARMSALKAASVTKPSASK
jgi:hypothetical protein